MSSSPTAAPTGGLRDARAVPPGNQVERLASTGAPASSPAQTDSVTGIRSSAPAVEARRAAAALKQGQRDELERIVAGTVDVGELLENSTQMTSIGRSRWSSRRASNSTVTSANWSDWPFKVAEAGRGSEPH